MRRIKTKGVLILVLLFLSLTADCIFSEDASLTVDLEDNILLASVALTGEHAGEVLLSLQEGLKSEIIFQFRLYQKKTGFFSFLGDRLIFEKKLSRTAYHDIFEDRFVIMTDGGGVQKYSQKDEFLKDFFQLQNFKLAEVNTKNLIQYYVLSRIRVNPVRFVPPLDIITLFFSRAAISTPWVESTISNIRGTAF